MSAGENRRLIALRLEYWTVPCWAVAYPPSFIMLVQITVLKLFGLSVTFEQGEKCMVLLGSKIPLYMAWLAVESSLLIILLHPFWSAIHWEAVMEKKKQQKTLHDPLNSALVKLLNFSTGRETPCAFFLPVLRTNKDLCLNELIFI